MNSEYLKQIKILVGIWVVTVLLLLSSCVQHDCRRLQRIASNQHQLEYLWSFVGNAKELQLTAKELCPEQTAWYVHLRYCPQVNTMNLSRLELDEARISIRYVAAPDSGDSPYDDFLELEKIGRVEFVHGASYRIVFEELRIEGKIEEREPLLQYGKVSVQCDTR